MKTKSKETERIQYFGVALPCTTVNRIREESVRQGRLRKHVVRAAIESFLALPEAEREEICR